MKVKKVYFRIMHHADQNPCSTSESRAPLKKQLHSFLPCCCILLILLTINCAYFNTFYNAEMIFKEAQNAHNKIMRNYPDSIIVTPTNDIGTKYDKVIDKSIKVLDVYPKDKKWHDDAVFLMAKAHFYKNEMTKAMRRIKELQEVYPSSPFIPESYLYLAKAYIQEDELIKAEDILQTVMSKYPQLNKDEMATLLLVDISVRREGKSQAIALLEKMRKSIRSEEKQLDLMLRTAGLYMDLKQYGKAVSLLEKAPRKKDLPVQLYRVDRSLMTCYIAMGRPELAFEIINAMLRNKLYKPHLRELTLNKGIILLEMGRTDEAMAIFKRMTSQLDSAAIDTTKTVGKAWLQLAKIYQKKKGDYPASRDCYLRASRFNDTTVTPEAMRHISAMDRIDTLRAQAAKADSLKKRAGKRFSIGEIFYYELDEPDSAYRQFIDLIADSAADTIVPKSLFAAASIARKDLKDTTRSDSLLKFIISKYPGSEFAYGSQQLMKVPVTIKTRRQAADEAFKEAEKTYLEDSMDVKAAVQAFFDIYKEYPDLEIAPKSLFVAAWLTDNELQKNKTAKSLYEKICEKYTESIYCSKEAKPRLKIVIDTLEAMKAARKKAGMETAKAAPAKGGKKPGTQKPDTVKAADTSKSLDSILGGESDLTSDSSSAAPQAGTATKPESTVVETTATPAPAPAVPPPAAPAPVPAPATVNPDSSRPRSTDAPERNDSAGTAPVELKGK